MTVEGAAVDDATHDDPGSRGRPARLERLLREALETQAITMHYQPLVELPSTRMVGVEALARWTHPELGPVPPKVFVAVAERAGLIRELGRQTLQQACSTAAAWGPDAEALVLNVNVSPLQLEHPDLVEVVEEVLSSTGLAPRRLCLEITETAAVEDFQRTDRRLEGLRRLGVQIALDDFGTGYSSLTVLRELRVDAVKMDRGFISHLLADARNAVVARLIIDASHAMGMRVCAEGVETDEQARQLVALGCDRAQGWLFAPATPGDDPRLHEAFGSRPFLQTPVSGQDAALGGTEELVLVTDGAGVIAFVSATAVRLMGASPSELIGAPVSTFLDREGADGSDGGLVEGTHRYSVRTVPGRRWLELTTRTVRDADERPGDLVAVGKDVTAVVCAQRELAASEQQFRRAFDEAPIGMAMTTLEGAFLRVNQAFADLLGMGVDDVMGSTVESLTVEQDRSADRENVEEVRRGAVQVHDLLKRYRHADGREVPVRVRAAVVGGQDGTADYILAHVLPHEPG